MRRILSLAVIALFVIATASAWACGPSGNAESKQGPPPSNQAGGFTPGAPDVTGQVTGSNGGGSMTPVTVQTTTGSGGTSGVSGGGGTSTAGGVTFSGATGSVVGTTSTDSGGNTVITPADQTANTTTGAGSPSNPWSQTPTNFSNGVFTPPNNDTRVNTTGFKLTGVQGITLTNGGTATGSAPPATGTFPAGAKTWSFTNATGSANGGTGSLSGDPSAPGAQAANISKGAPLWDANQRYSDEP